MDALTSATIYKLSIHEHPLFPSARIISSACSACGEQETMYGGYYCNNPECFPWFFHKKCAEAPLEISHPYHPQHPLLLTNNSSDNYDTCDLCGEYLMTVCYGCSTCEFKVDLSCGINPSPPPVIEHPICHDHPLTLWKKREENCSCKVCKEDILGPSYLCLECNVHFHLHCVYLSREVNHPCHSNHPIKLIESETLMDDAETICFSCQQQPKYVIYHCYICNFSICLVCTRNPPPLVIEHTKTHIHQLTLFSRKMKFTCDVCGENGNGGPYVCLQCAFLLHAYCIDLPRVININRHDHCISFTHHLGVGYSKCGVCRKSLSQYHGGYFCSVCPKYAVHCRCAVSLNVWDHVELERIPDAKYIAPFKMVGDDLIIHFSHKNHPLKIYKNNILYDNWLQCEACIHPLGFDSIYGCEECGFVLHEKCANLPMKKRLIFGTTLYFLGLVDGVVDECLECGVIFDGFNYKTKYELIADVHCASLYEPFVHDGHLHPLYFDDEEQNNKCNACKKFVWRSGLRCDVCDFKICYYCATLPLKIWHKDDDHPITLCCGVKMSIKNWCDICEKELDDCKWFYTCYACEIILHVQCVLGDFSRLKPEKIIEYRGKRFEVVRNNRSGTRPLCSQCHSRCKVSIVLKNCDRDNGYICSDSCLFQVLWSYFSACENV